MNKSAKKWVKRLLLWLIGFPVALILVLYISLELCVMVAPDSFDRAIDSVLRRWMRVDVFDDMEGDLKLIAAPLNHQNYDSVHVVCDSLEGRTKIPNVDLHFFHGVAYINQKRPKLAEFQFRKALSSFTNDETELLSYIESVQLLSKLLIDHYDYEGAMEVMVPCLKIIKEHESDFIMLPPYAASDIYTAMGNCLVALERYDEGERHYQEAIESYKRNNNELLADTSLDSDTLFVKMKMITGNEAAIAYINKQLYDKASAWFSVAKESYHWLQKNIDINSTYFRKERFLLSLVEAQLLLHQGKEAEAYQVFQTYLDNIPSSWAMGIRECGQFLLKCHHWQEALDMYQRVDSTGIDLTRLTIDDINTMLVPQYKALRGLGSNQKALAMSDSICGALDSALVRWRNSDALELAIIYDTQGKEAQIARKEASLTRLWWIGTTIVLGLVILSFIIYTIYRRRITKMQAVQERIESELRIARDIQMSMVPSVFPEREGLDMYATMTPAKAVGGDLYGYLLLGDKLYFALGDVSGKGVPASLFMAQATRLFLTLAKQGMMPAEICTRMNDALSGDDNESGMFVTFWLGLVDLTTGHLDFCNAGHNPPIIGGGESHGDFLEMIPNAPIGLFPDLNYEGEEIDNIKGHPLFLYTDGLNEAENRQQKQFGDDRLLDILRHTHFDTAQQIINTLKTKVEVYRDGAEPNDDLTMMCLKVD